MRLDDLPESGNVEDRRGEGGGFGGGGIGGLPIGGGGLGIGAIVVLGLIATGLSNREIADQLVVSEATVKTHVGRILSKLDARDRAQLVVFAYESGFVIAGRR